MVPLSHVLAFAAVVSVLIAIPGPSVLFTISRALTVGRRAALLTVAGNEIGLCVQVIAVAFGIGAVLERSAQVVTAVKLAGAVYLIYLGVQAVRHRKSVAEALARPVAAAAGPDRRRRRTCDDRPGPQRGGGRPQGLAAGQERGVLPNLFDGGPIRRAAGCEAGT
jgi:threonine/homoserine/homoserine lactone efflux protein